MYLLAYARAMITMYFGLDACTEEHETDGFKYLKSNYHYELVYGAECVAFIKSIVKNSNIRGTRRVFVIRGLASADNQHKLKYLLDKYSATYIITSKTVGNIEPSVLSRALMLRLAFDKEKLARFLESYNIEVPAAGKSIVCAIAKVGETSYEKKLKELLKIMATEKSEIKVARAIREYSFNVYQKCIPIPVLGRKIISYVSDHPSICEIVTTCAEADHARAIGTKELLNYEQMFVNVWQLVAEKKSL